MSPTTKHRSVGVGSCRLSNTNPLSVIAGPCIIESAERTGRIAAALRQTCRRLGMGLIFKCSYDKANRTSSRSYRGPGIRDGLVILEKIKKRLGVPLLVDIHSPGEAARAAEVADVLQVPAFLCRQTDLILAAARTGKAINVKKGQFLSPSETRPLVDKIRSAGNDRVTLTERGTTFGYNNLVVDMRGLDLMKGMGVPVIFDATHSVQLPGGEGRRSGGQREFIFPLARAAVAVGVAGIFMEVHPRPEVALSDGPNAVRLSQVASLLKRLRQIDRVAKKASQGFHLS